MGVEDEDEDAIKIYHFGSRSSIDDDTSSYAAEDYDSSTIAGLSILRSASSFKTNLTGIFSADSSTGTTTGRSILPSASSALSLKNNLTAILGIDDDNES